LDAVESALDKGGYLVDDRFSAADLYLGSHLGWGTQFGTIPSRPAFEAYLKLLQARPAFEKARQIDAGLIAQMQSA
jgi:glutathione S-transferase